MSISFSLSSILTLLGQPYSFQLQCLSPAVPQYISPDAFLLGIHLSSFSLSAFLSPSFLLFLYPLSIAHFINLIIKWEITWCVQWRLWLWYASDVEIEWNGKDKCSITTASPLLSSTRQPRAGAGVAFHCEENRHLQKEVHGNSSLYILNFYDAFLLSF